MFVATIHYNTNSGFRKTLSFSHPDERVVNQWINHKRTQLFNRNCTNINAYYTAS